MIYLVLTAVIAYLFSLIPFPAHFGWLSPNWMIIGLLLFQRYRPSTPLLAAFLLGLGFDLLTDGLLGVHALCCVVSSHFINRYQQDLLSGSLVHQLGVVAISTGIYQLILLWVLGLTHQNPGTLLHWMPVISTTMIGPMLFRFVSARLPRRVGVVPTLL